MFIWHFGWNAAINMYLNPTKLTIFFSSFKEKKGHICSFSRCILACIWGMLILTFGNWKIMEVFKNNRKITVDVFQKYKSLSVPELPSLLNFSLSFLSTEFDFFFSPPLSNMWISHSGTTCLRLIKKIGLRKRTNKPAECEMHSDLMPTRFDWTETCG